MRTPRFGRLLGCAVLVLAAPAARAGVTFRPIALPAANQAAANEGKLVFVDFYTTWCEPCKRLDAQTWSDDAVGRLVDTHAVALKLDAEKEGREAAKRYKVTAYPTLLLLKADGTIVDRIVGFREPAALISEFQAAMSGKTALNRTRQAVASAGSATDEQVQARQNLARELARSGRNDEALAEYLWLYDEGMKQARSFTGVRTSFLTGDMGRLAREYSPAADALRARRDDAKKRLLADPADRDAPREFSALNEALGESAANLELFDSLPRRDPRRRGFGIRLFDHLVAAQRYADALDIQDYRFASSLLDAQLRSRPSALPEPTISRLRQSAFRRAAINVEVLAGAGELDHAAELAKKILAADNSAETRADVLEHAGRAGHADLLGTVAR